MKLNRLALFLALVSLAALPLFAAQEGSFDRTLKVSGTVDLDVSPGSGTINVTRGSDGQVVIRAVIRASDFGWFSGDQTEKIRAIESNPPIEQSGNVIRVGHFSDSSLQRNISINYDIR